MKPEESAKHTQTLSYQVESEHDTNTLHWWSWGYKLCVSLTLKRSSAIWHILNMGSYWNTQLNNLHRVWLSQEICFTQTDFLISGWSLSMRLKFIKTNIVYASLRKLDSVRQIVFLIWKDKVWVQDISPLKPTYQWHTWFHHDGKLAPCLQVSVDARRLVTGALEQGRIYTVNSEVTNQLGSSQHTGNGKPAYHLRSVWVLFYKINAVAKYMV